MNIKKKSLIILFILLIIIPVVSSAEDFTHVISNSGNWQDVYSTLHYANLNKVGNDFLVSTKHGDILLNGIRKENKIRVITSNENPFVFNYPGLILSKDFAGADEIKVDSANLELIKELEDIDKFIIVGDSYGYNAIAVVPYAKITNSWIFLANRINVYEIDSILSGRNIENIIIYGFVDREVRDILSKYDPEIIDTGDKFEDNIEIAKRYLEINPLKQTILTNGEFIEREIMAGSEPVLFTGRENVPDQIRDYLKQSDIEVGVLIGNDLVGAATNIRRTAGISVMVKFARGARSQTSGIAAVEGLDLFPLPTPSVDLSLNSIKYNKASSQLEVTYKSNSNVPIYFKGTITLISDLETKKVGDNEAIFISPNDFKTVTYPLTLRSTENLIGELYTLYGETRASLDRILEERVDIDVVEIIDKCKLERKNIRYVKYSKQTKAIIIKIKNSIDVDCWVDLELDNVIIGYRVQTIGTEGSTKIPAEKTKKITIEQEMSKEDLERNPEVELIAYSGEREESLVNIFPAVGEDNKFKLQIETMTLLTYGIIGLVIVIILLIIIMIILKRREEEYY